LIKFVKMSSKYIVVLSIVVLLSACGTDSTSKNKIDTGAAQFVDATVIDDINASTMLAYVKGGIDVNATNAFAYKAVKITYNTVNEDNVPVVASGLLVIPTATDKYKASRALQGQVPFTVSMLCDNHITIFANTDAPTTIEVSDGKPNYTLAILESGYAGFAGIYPDYIGFGSSLGTVHPYIMKKASARASLDMIKASMKYMEDHGVILNHQLYITGYSEGGYVAMATAQKVENELGSVNLMGVAPMAGPYNVKDLADIELNATHLMAYPGFLADLAYSYSHYYDANLSEIANANISIGQFQTAFSGNYDTVAIHTILGLADPANDDYGFYTHKADELFSTTFLNSYNNNVNNTMKVKFEENNLDNWTPRSKMNFIQCIDDDIIPFSESNNTYNKFKSNGADVILTGIPTAILHQQKDARHLFVHVNCGETAYIIAVKWFAAIRNGDI
jgi:pimeloyl-ACP methyl ester carboxylesterase